MRPIIILIFILKTLSLNGQNNYNVYLVNGLSNIYSPHLPEKYAFNFGLNRTIDFKKNSFDEKVFMELGFDIGYSYGLPHIKPLSGEKHEITGYDNHYKIGLNTTLNTIFNFRNSIVLISSGLQPYYTLELKENPLQPRSRKFNTNWTMAIGIRPKLIIPIHGIQIYYCKGLYTLQTKNHFYRHRLIGLKLICNL